uniref:AAA domain-containing protein n=1 Tax=Syphacia muris TaxID=451379 RepID=A0A0N5APF8_9BILA
MMEQIKVPLLTQSDRYKVLTMDIGNEADSKDLWEITCQTQVMLLIPKVSWDDIGGLEEVKAILQEAVNCMLSEKGYKKSGIILYGPPGCGKTLLAKAVANQFSFPILNIKGPELFNKFVGESESNIRKVFKNARQVAPCVMFFDELDALVPNRGRSSEFGGVCDRIVSQFLTEMDDILEENVLVLGATNRLDLLDPSLLVPGRFERTILVSTGCDVTSCLSILRAASRKITFTNDVDLLKIAEFCSKWASGADLHSLVSQGVLDAIRDYIQQNAGEDAEDSHTVIVSQKNLIHALKEVSKKNRVSYYFCKFTFCSLADDGYQFLYIL